MAVKKSPRKIYCIDEKGNKILDLKQWKIKNFGKIYYDSYFEYEAAQLLNKAGFHVDFHPESRELIPAFKATLQPHEIFVIVYDLETLKDLIDIINKDYKGSSKNPQAEVVKQKTINI